MEKTVNSVRYLFWHTLKEMV